MFSMVITGNDQNCGVALTVAHANTAAVRWPYPGRQNLTFIQQDCRASN